MAAQLKNGFISRKRYAQSNWPSSTDMKKEYRNGYLPEESPTQLDWCDDIAILAQSLSKTLGLKRNFLKEVEFVPDDILHHRSLKGLLIIYIENAYHDIEDQSLKEKLSPELLNQIGFDDRKVIATLMKRWEKMSQHLGPLDFIKRYINDEFKYNPTLYAQEDMTSPDGYKNDEQSEPPGVTRLFHGTDLYSAVDIMKNGIELDYGRHKHDFSDGGGFYLTTSFEHAKAWAHSQTRKPVVLELKIPKICFGKAFTQWSLDVSTKEGRSDWDWVVRGNRSGRPSKQLRQELEKYDCIAGPISVPSCPGSKDRVPKPNSHQLCVVKRRFADEIEHDAKYALYALYT